MHAISMRLGHNSSVHSSLKSIYPLGNQYYYGYNNTRFGSTVAPKGVGHLVRRGTGGRSSVSGIIATLFGATGFLGRYVVQQLAKMGSQFLVPFCGSEDSHRHLKLRGYLGQIVPMKYNPRDEDSIKAVMAKSNVVMNLIDCERTWWHYEVHSSFLLGASSPSPSRYLRAKADAEESVLRELPEATVMRPAVMIGTEDRILNPWTQFVKKYAFVPLIGDGSTRIQPPYVVDVAAAIVAPLKDDGISMGKVYELGGPKIFATQAHVTG